MKQIPALFIVLLVIITACSENGEIPEPSVVVGSGGEMVTHGDTIGEGTLMKFRLLLNGNGSHISNLVATITQGDQKRTMMDIGLWKTSLDTVVAFYKGNWETEQWTFTAMTSERTFATASLTIYRDTVSAYDPIVTYPDITLSFQGGTGAHYFDAETGETLTETEAAQRQDEVDFVVYYYVDGSKPSPTFSSPGDEDAATYYPAIKSWNTFNYTKWDYVSQTTVAAFDQAETDSLLIAKYDDVWGRRKYKYAYAGWVFPFRTTNGKIGLVKVIRADNDANGTIQFAVKVQP